MAGARRLLIWVAAAVAILTLSLLAANIGRTELGGNWDGVGPLRDLETMMFPLAMGIWIILIVWYCIRLLTNRRKGRRKATVGRNPSSYGILAMLAVVGLVVLLAGPGGSVIFPSDPNGSSDQTDQPVPEPGAGTPGGNDLIVVGMAIALIIVLMPFMVRYVRGHSFDRSSNPQFKEEEVVDRSIEAVARSTGDELRDAIMNAYLELLRMISDRMPGGENLTPRELADISVTRFGWPKEDVEGLTEVFELARYSDHPLGETEKTRALRCLEGIKAALREEGKR